MSRSMPVRAGTFRLSLPYGRQSGGMHWGTDFAPPDGVVPAPTASDHATTKSYVDVAAACGTQDAASGLKGRIRLAGDLGGIASVPTVPALRLERW
jgi:hypothetical protein